MKFTERALRILEHAEREAEKTTNIVYPVHLLSGILLERTGVCAELYMYAPKLWDIVNERVRGIYFNESEQGISKEPFTINISLSTEQVLEDASNRMKYFKQIYINEGHLADALFRNTDQSMRTIVDGLDVSRILEIMSDPRDMIVSLKDYSFPIIHTTHLNVKKAEKNDAASLITFVEKEFGSRWLESIEYGLLEDDIPIFIAFDDHQIVGFACYDVVRRKKGLFGPMGTSFSKRVQGIGYTLLHNCLREMKETGYEYAVIGNAGPVEFYEKACNAVVIPKTR